MAEPSLSWDQFMAVELRAGTIIKAEAFPEAKKPAYKLLIDFGPRIGLRKTSAQITDHYQPETLVGRQILGVVNFPPKQIGPMMSECLVTGIYQDDGSVMLAVPDRAVPNGARLG
ncbi:tRNA-binding protein [Iodidimonas nitroreducens]|uniref:tRNA-binding protein n=1 Tax=Iodidimonas nitroreducens TaxID=1236968 RepID=A0A5A7N622_9PROT|nr:tRNA-binding protein [Iodidimonas nitroreducens]GAK33032.1 protein CsaA [alpha proteobacterium Q-1]GER03457.1 tRNA-binding protein [Iodidimonas nitroreducens]